jgi:cytochrome c551/c552
MRQGLRQGDVLSTLLFNVVLEATAKLQMTDTIFNNQTQLLAYADDIDIVGRSLEAVHDAYLVLGAEAAKVGLKINKQETKYMIAVGNRTILDAGQIVAFGDKNFEGVNEFVYLGALMTPKNDLALEIQRRVLQIGASAACENISGHLTWHVRQSNDLEDLDPPGPAVRY